MENRIVSVTDRLLQRITLASKLWLSMAATLLLGVLILSIAFQADQRHLSEQQLRALGTAISQQTAASSSALILAGDELSLSINLQQLAALTQISGAEVFDRKGGSLAQAGQPSELFVDRPILSEQTVLGSLRIHLNPATKAYAMVLPLTLAMAAVTLLLLLSTTFILARHLSRPLQALLYASEQLGNNQLIEPLDQQRHDEFGQIAQRLSPRFAEAVAESEAEPYDESEAAPETEPESSPSPTNRAETLSEYADNRDPLESDDLTAQSLLTDNDDNSAIAASNNSDTLISQPTESTASTPIPATQGYLFYINHHVGGSDTLIPAEREQLLVRYRKALMQVARLYKGEFDEDALGNWCVRFSPLSNDQSHGINALCAAQLFNALYRGINAQAIRSFSPALNMKLVLLCGPIHSFETLAEDALLLSDLIQDNDLITHKALYQTPALQDRMLGSAKYRKFDDDTYLVAALNDDYQTLIDRQAEHFLKQNA